MRVHDKNRIIEGMATRFAAKFRTLLEQNEIENLNYRYFNISNSKQQFMIRESMKYALDFFLDEQEKKSISRDSYSRLDPFNLPE
jgi:hypothetical protein